jgi:FemAB-related protein (PEP-CTERM system-associated)
MEASFGMQCRFLFARDGERIQGILPLLQVNSLISGKYFTSMPGSLLADNEEAATILGNHAQELLKQGGAKYALLRDSYHKWELDGLVTNHDLCTFRVNLYNDPGTMWKKIDRRVRQHTRHALDAGLQTVIGPEYLDEFYPAYARTMHEMGTPAYGAGFFKKVLEEFPRHFTVVLVRQKQEVLGGIIAATFKSTIYNIWWGMLPNTYKIHSCHALYWEIFKYGCANGFTDVDLGRSEINSGTYQFKHRWPAEPVPLFEQFYLNGNSQIPAIGSERIGELKYRLFVKVWQRIPLSLTNALGPGLRKHVPFG